MSWWSPTDKEYKQLKKAVDADFFTITRLARQEAQSWLGGLYPQMWSAIRFELECNEDIRHGRYTGGATRFVFEFDLRGKPTYVEVELSDYGSGPEALVTACHEIVKKV